MPEQDADRPSPPDDEVEKHWLAAVARGDRGAFEALFRRYHPRLLRFCHRLGGGLESLDEIVSDTLLVVWRRAADYDGRCRPSTWIFGIAYRKVLETRRRDRRSRRFDSLEDHRELSGSCSGQRQETADWLHQAMKELPEEQRIAVELTFYHGMSYQEISRIMGCPENTVKTRMFHARKKLKTLLQRLEDTPPRRKT